MIFVSLAAPRKSIEQKHKPFFNSQQGTPPQMLDHPKTWPEQSIRPSLPQPPPFSKNKVNIRTISSDLDPE